jgi:Glycosyl transferase family 2
MRIGSNPNNHKEIDLSIKSHRVIIPIYIPNAEGYFADAFNVLKVCIESLLKTINGDTAITLISNASSQEVNLYISKLFEEKKIDKAVFNSKNIGKMNAIITETRASFEEFITFSDSDVFFDQDWLYQTYSMFKKCTNAGFVSMNPTPNNFVHADSTLFSNFYNLIFKKQKTNSVCSFEDLEHFHKSIGRDKEATIKMYNEKCLTIFNEKYIIGAGHFCCTIRKTPTLKFVPKEESKIGVSGGSESVYLDIPFDKTGLLRISSPKAYVWHMGNILEKEWAQTKLESMSNFQEKEFRFENLPFKNRAISSYILPYQLKKLFVRILKKLFLK